MPKVHLVGSDKTHRVGAHTHIYRLPSDPKPTPDDPGLPARQAFFWNGVADLDKADADYLASQKIVTFDKKDAFGLCQLGEEPAAVIDAGGNKVPATSNKEAK